MRGFVGRLKTCRGGMRVFNGQDFTGWRFMSDQLPDKVANGKVEEGYLRRDPGSQRLQSVVDPALSQGAACTGALEGVR